MLRICCTSTPAAGNALICNLGAAHDHHRLRLPLAFSALASSAATRAASASAALHTHRPSEPLDALLSVTLTPAASPPRPRPASPPPPQPLALPNVCATSGRSAPRSTRRSQSSDASSPVSPPSPAPSPPHAETPAADATQLPNQPTARIEAHLLRLVVPLGADGRLHDLRRYRRYRLVHVRQHTSHAFPRVDIVPPKLRADGYRHARRVTGGREGDGGCRLGQAQCAYRCGSRHVP